MSERARSFVLEDALAVFRGLESVEDAIIILDDEDALRVMVAWKKLDHSWTRPGPRMPQPIAGKLGRLWTWVVQGWDIDVDKVSKLVGLPWTTTHDKIEMLVGNRLIYPDGSTSKYAQTALMRYTSEKLGMGKKKEPKPETAPKTDKAKTTDTN